MKGLLIWGDVPRRGRGHSQEREDAHKVHNGNSGGSCQILGTWVHFLGLFLLHIRSEGGVSTVSVFEDAIIPPREIETDRINV